MLDSKKRLTVAALAAAVVLVPMTSAAASAAPSATPSAAPSVPVRQLDRIAHPLTSTDPGAGTADLQALGAMVGNAKVVGLGEATHGSHEFFALKDRVFRYLVEKKGFTSFALEMSWSAGLRIDDYLQHGGGDARQIVHETMAGSPWDREEFVTLVQWMRDYNVQHPAHPVHFVGDDVGAPSLDAPVFDAVTGYVQRTHPESLPRLNALLAGLRPLNDAIGYLDRPLAERQGNASKAQQVLAMMQSAGAPGDRDYEYALQNARNIAQTYTFLSVNVTDPASLTAMERYRDQVMADNTAWWLRYEGGRILLSAHDDHVGYLATDPATYPKTQGAFLHDALGSGYVAIGTTFDRGSFLSKSQALGGDWQKFTLPAAPVGSNEYTLDQVRYRDYYVDLRKAPAAARAWLDQARPTYNVGTQFPVDGTPELAVGHAFDVLIHLHSVTAATKL